VRRTVQRALSVPGKLFLSGEYAVLWGGTARLCAVGPRVAALVRRRADREVHLVLATGRLVGRTTPLGARWEGAEVPETFRFAARAVDEALRAVGGEPLGFELALEPSPVSPEGRKLGFGGSAMAAVLASEASRFVLEAKFDALKLALVAHASAQGGKGSGADVACSFAGGVVRYRRFDTAGLLHASSSGTLSAALGTAPPVELWRLPNPRVHLGYAFTRKSASTPLMVAKVEARLSREARARFVAASEDLGDALERAMAAGDFPLVRESVEGLQALLGTLGGVATEEMAQIIALCRTAGAVAKLSGAGGGDGCVLFAPDEGTLNAALEALGSRGFHAFGLTVEPGLRGESSPSPMLPGWLHG
jgi:phosphomevalonate kinase